MGKRSFILFLTLLTPLALRAQAPELTDPEESEFAITVEPTRSAPAASSTNPEDLYGATEPREAASLEAVSRRRAEKHLPLWARKPAKWGVQLDFSLKALGGEPDFPGGLRNTKIRAISIQPEIQPLFLQKIGIVSLGPSLTGYLSTESGSIAQSNNLTNDVRGLWAWGAQIRYQAKFFRKQPLVPVVSGQFQQLRYGLVGLNAGEEGEAGQFWVAGFSFGGMLLLNVLENETADQMFLNVGIKRSYLIAELRGLSGSDENISISGRSLHFGLRFEF